MNEPNFQNDQLFTGLILSDGYLRKITTNTGKSNFQIKQTPKRIDFLFTIQKYFLNLGIESTLRQYKMGKYDQAMLTTRSTKTLGKQRIRWYVNNKKIIPYDLELKPKGIAYWYMGDGGVWRGGKNKNSVKVTLYTNSFSEEGTKFLISKLQEFEIEVNLNLKRKHEPVIIISKWKSVIKFMDLVKPYILPCFQYKIQYPTIEKKGGRPSRTKEAQKAYWNSLPIEVRKARNKKRWDKIKNIKNAERRTKYKTDPNYRTKILVKQRSLYKEKPSVEQ